jgi:hypothetical protein
LSGSDELINSFLGKFDHQVIVRREREHLSATPE